MKLPPARIERFLAAPEQTVRAALVYGPDAGLVRERADRLGTAIVPELNDAFRTTDLAAETLAADPARLDDEARALSLVPGRRLVRVREAGDAVGALFERFFKALPPGDSFILVEAGELGTRSSLRRAFEAARDGVAIACYADGPEELRELVRATLGARRIQISAEAIEYLAAHLGADRMQSRQELEKLALYVGDGGRLGEAEAEAVVGDTAALSLEDAVFAAADGSAAQLERALQRAFDEGESPVAVLRAALRHFQRLHLAGVRIAAGASPQDAIERLRPPVFFKQRERFLAHLRRWPPHRAAQALERLLAAERDAKRTVIPPEPVCREALLAIVRGGGPADRGRPARA